MSMLQFSQTPREEIHAARSRRARAWAWPVRLLLIGCLATAVWQEPQLWPRGHAAMQGAWERVAQAVRSNDQVRGFFARLTGGQSGGTRVGLADKLAASLSR
ncbi:MAG: hypothetical protein CMN17_12030 [Roseovarius sp.]|nr:hypothetical protein [Roseovarius sp.]MBK44082.1 hypothetical protein [Roseovarius sp.]